MTILHSQLFYLAFIGYLIASFLYSFGALLDTPNMSKWAFRIGLIGWIAHTAAIILRWLDSGFIPVSNMYESLSFFAWAIVAGALWVDRKMKFPAIAWLTMIVGVVMIGIASLMPSTIKSLAPALQSHWLKLHVTFAFLGDAAFAIAFVAGLLFLLKQYFSFAWVKRLPEADKLDKISYRFICIGLPIFTIGALIFGAIWAYYAWGSYWSWDPKETWALITFLIYALYLHLRFKKGMTGKISAWFAVLGFMLVIFTYFGVNFLLAGLHSYN